MDFKYFISKVIDQEHCNGATAFKLLGLMVFIANEGSEALLSGEIISSSTYNRWMEKIKTAGYGAIIAEARLRQIVDELPTIEAKTRALETLKISLEEDKS